MKRLICDRKHRLGKNGVQELKDHLFFKGIDWKHIRDRKFMCFKMFLESSLGVINFF